MNLKKRQIYIIFISLILLTGILIVSAAINVDKTKAYHSGSNVNLSITGSSERNLQQVINSNRLMGGYNYGSSSAPNPGHNASEIWVSVNGNEKTLQNALITGLCGNGTLTTKYSTPNLLVYQYANEINITISETEMSLQNAIDTGKFCSSWATGSCTGTCGGTGTRTVYCKRSDGAQLADGWCISGSKPSSSCTPTCWQRGNPFRWCYTGQPCNYPSGPCPVKMCDDGKSPYLEGYEMKEPTVGSSCSSAGSTVSCLDRYVICAHGTQAKTYICT